MSKVWVVFSAEGSLRELQQKLNQLEQDGRTIHSVLPPIEVSSSSPRIRGTSLMWAIVTYIAAPPAQERTEG